MSLRWCIIRVVTTAANDRRLRRLRLQIGPSAAALLLAVAVAACGGSPSGTPSATATPPAGSTPTTSPTIAAAPTPTPGIAIVPVPGMQLAAPGSAAAHLDATTAAALQTALDGLRNSAKYPGASAAVMFPDGSIWTGASGNAIQSPAVPLTTDTIMSIGSISKTFVSALVGRLVQAGTIGLDDPLSKYVPTFTNASKITIRELLDHTSGIRDLFKVKTMNAAIMANKAATWTADKVLANIGPQLYSPGSHYYYSNTDYVLLGKVIEKATGKSLSSLVRTDFLTPLGMTHTFLQTEEKVTGSEAHGYMRKGANASNAAGKMIPFTSEVTAVGPAGAFVSTASDLAVWANALYGGYVLDEATLASIVDVSPTSRFVGHALIYGSGYGLGFEEATVDGQTAWGHRGHLDGFWSAMEYLPANHLSIVVLTNADWANPMTAASALAKAAIG
jgi:D-alanyl-D-alanine carboxypeptidase